MYLLKIHDNTLLSSVPYECEYYSLYVNKVKSVHKTHAQSSKKELLAKGNR